MNELPAPLNSMATKDDRPSKIRRLFEPLRKIECVWPDPEASVGQFLQMIGRYSCWEAVGPARDKFNSLAEEIGEYLREFSDPVTATVTWSLYMTGRKKVTARPTLTFVSHEADARRKIRKVIEDSGLVSKYQGFIIMDCNRPPGFQSLTSLGLDERNRVAVGSGPKHLVKYRAEDLVYNGVKILVSNSLNSDTHWNRATGGGVLHWNNRYFLTTAAHIFQRSDEWIFPKDEDCNEFQFDLDDDDFPVGDDDDDELAESTSRASRSPEADWAEMTTSSEIISHTSSTSLLSQVSGKSVQTAFLIESKADQNPAYDNLEDTPMSEVSSVSNSLSESCKTSNSSLWSEEIQETAAIWSFTSSLLEPNEILDYALVELENYGQWRTEIWSTENVEHEICKSLTSSREVLACTATKGDLRGRLSGTPTFLQAPQGKKSRELWTVHLDGTFEKGDCGCWIVDATTGLLYGYVVAGSAGHGSCFIVPFRDMIHDLEQRFTGVWSPISRMRTRSIPTHGILSDLARPPLVALAGSEPLKARSENWINDFDERLLPKATTNGPLQCRHCGVSFIKKRDRIVHERTEHAAENVTPCKHCGALFAFYWQKSRHDDLYHPGQAGLSPEKPD